MSSDLCTTVICGKSNSFKMFLWSIQPECSINNNIVISFTLACSSKGGCGLLLFSTCFLYRWVWGRWKKRHRDYWGDVGRFKRVKITRDRFTLDVLCCILLLLYLRKIGGLQIILCAERLSYLVCCNLSLTSAVLFRSI